jgi:hypothetical protein
VVSDGQSVTAAAPPKSRRLRNVLLIAIAFAVVLGAAAAGTLFYIYDKATAIDRSTPEVVVGQFLRATLVEKDARRVSLFVCPQWTASAAASDVAAPANPKVSVSWGDYVTRQSGPKADVDLRVYFSVAVGNGYQQDVQSWTLHLENQDGWRVCALTKNGSLSP